MDQLESNNINKRSSGVGFAKMPPGPFLAKVVNHLDPKRQGALRASISINLYILDRKEHFSEQRI